LVYDISAAVLAIKLRLALLQRWLGVGIDVPLANDQELDGDDDGRCHEQEEDRDDQDEDPKGESTAPAVPLRVRMTRIANIVSGCVIALSTADC
jgi:hypothetical protein